MVSTLLAVHIWLIVLICQYTHPNHACLLAHCKTICATRAQVLCHQWADQQQWQQQQRVRVYLPCQLVCAPSCHLCPTAAPW
jgi:hypothetical protein